jgi:hypothetical protein
VQLSLLLVKANCFVSRAYSQDRWFCLQVLVLSAEARLSFHDPAEAYVLLCRALALVRFLGDASSSLGDAKSSQGDAKSSLGDGKSSLGDAKSSLGGAKSSLGDVNISLGGVCGSSRGGGGPGGGELLSRDRF